MQSRDSIDEMMDAIERRFPGSKAEADRIIEEYGGNSSFKKFWAKLMADKEVQKLIALTNWKPFQSLSLKSGQRFLRYRFKTLSSARAQRNIKTRA